jgi:hypothetical protein
MRQCAESICAKLKLSRSFAISTVLGVPFPSLFDLYQVFCSNSLQVSIMKFAEIHYST